MSSMKGSQTEKNLLAAFAGESQARNRYTYYAGAARKEGFVQIADVFEETANQEREHAKRFFKFLEGSDVEIQASFPAGVIGTTAVNLKAGRFLKKRNRLSGGVETAGTYTRGRMPRPHVQPVLIHRHISNSWRRIG